MISQGEIPRKVEGKITRPLRNTPFWRSRSNFASLASLLSPLSLNPDQMLIVYRDPDLIAFDVMRERTEIFQGGGVCRHRQDWNNRIADEPTASLSTAICVVSTRSPYRIISVSSEFSALVNFSEHELLGRSFAILRGPETDAPIMHSAIKAADANPQHDVCVTLYGSTGDSRAYAASFAPALDCEGHAIGCRISILPLEEAPAPSAPPARRCDAAPSPGVRLRGSTTANRQRYNRDVGMLLDSEARRAAARAAEPTAAARLEEEALLGRLLAEACA